MTHRERVMAAVRHEEPDRVPLFYRDVPEVRTRLMEDLRCPDFETLLQHLDIDFRWVGPEYVGPPLEDESTGRRRDIWGVEYEYVPFSETAGYWETAGHPLADCDDPAALGDYAWPELEWFDFSTLVDQAAACEDYAIMTAPGVPSDGILQFPIQCLVGPEKSFLDMAMNPRFFDALVRRVLDFRLPFIDRMLAAAGDRIDFCRIGDDYGSQNGLLIGPEMWKHRIGGALREMAGVASRHGAHYYHHSCGAVRALIGELIDIGVDVLDPVQVKAAGMIPAELKAEFGDHLCFSGGLDGQDLLPRGSPADVREGVFRLLDGMAPGGGFFLGPTHNFQDDIPTENIVAMYDAAREWSY